MLGPRTCRIRADTHAMPSRICHNIRFFLGRVTCEFDVPFFLGMYRRNLANYAWLCSSMRNNASHQFSAKSIEAGRSYKNGFFLKFSLPCVLCPCDFPETRGLNRLHRMGYNPRTAGPCDHPCVRCEAVARTRRQPGTPLYSAAAYICVRMDP